MVRAMAASAVDGSVCDDVIGPITLRQLLEPRTYGQMMAKKNTAEGKGATNGRVGEAYGSEYIRKGTITY